MTNQKNESLENGLNMQKADSIAQAVSAPACPPAIAESELSRLRALFEQAPSFIAVVHGPDHTFVLANKAYCELVGSRHLLGMPARAALPEIEKQHYLDLLTQAYESGQPYVGRQSAVTLQHTHGEQAVTRYVDFVYQPLVGPDCEVYGLFIEGHDVTEQKLAMDALKASNERWMFAVEGARDGVWDWDLTTGCIFVSWRCNETLGSAEPVLYRSVRDWLATIHPEDESRVHAELEIALQEGTPYSIEYRKRCQNGDYKWVLSRGIIVARDEAGRPTRLTGTMSDISEKKAVEETIWRHASIDHLTGLPNRRLFRDRLEHQARRAHREGGEFALLFIDLDRFKEVNDLRGHDAGDELLAQVARRLTDCVRASDTVARLGGDEFTIILTDLHGRGHVEQVAQKLITSVAAPYQLAGDTVHLSASIGITLHPSDGNHAEALIRNADQAMYAAKNAGRNQFRFFTLAMQEAAQTRIQMIQEMRNAFANGGLQVFYQPIVELKSGQISKAEALLRWTHPADGAVSPSNFIPLAEESGLIHKLGDWVFKEAAACSKKWGGMLGRPFQVSVNCSPVQILAGDVEKWPAFLAAHDLPSPSITIEITEGVLLNASPRVAEVFARYRQCGIQIALDDFGTGYSSLSYLTQFEIDFLKIDQSFVRGIDTSETSRAIVESMIVMAHRLGLKVIAEGIETVAQENVLRAASCDFGQGHLFSKAVPAASLYALLVQQARGPVD